MWIRLGSSVLLGSALLVGGDIHGTITIERKLTKHNITASAGMYQRGVSVELGTDAEQGPLEFERSHVAVYIETPSTPAPTEVVKASIEQKDRRFVPDLVVVPAGSAVSFPNFDPIFHNVFSLSKAKSFDLGNYPKGQSRVLTFATPGIVAVYCHLHPNMAATIVVAPSRWAVRADEKGAFTLKDVPSGTYMVVAWHKAVGTFRRTVTIGANADAEADFTLPYIESPEADHIAHK